MSSDGSLAPEEYADDHPNRRRTFIGGQPHGGLKQARAHVSASSDPRDITVMRVPIRGTIHRIEIVEHFAIISAQLYSTSDKTAPVWTLEPPHKVPEDRMLIVRLMTPPETAPGRVDTFLEIWFSPPSLVSRIVPRSSTKSRASKSARRKKPS